MAFPKKATKKPSKGKPFMKGKSKPPMKEGSPKEMARDKKMGFKEGSSQEEAMDSSSVSTKGGNSFPLKGRKAFGGL